ncbi:retrovirus-related pol polyprotein from transposon TNT 1-94 [Tanacetum coccineum]
MTNHVAKLDTKNKENIRENESLTAELERYKERVKQFEERQNVNLSQCEKLIDSQMDDMIQDRNAKFAAIQKEIDTLKQDLSKHVKEKESLSTNLSVFKTETKGKESKSMDKEIALGTKNKELENIISKMSQRIKPTLYDGNVITKQHAVVFVIDDEETLILEEESRSKMSEKLNDPKAIKMKINPKLIDYVKLNQLSEDFRKRFFPQMELSAEQAYWLLISNPKSEKSETPVKIKVHVELPKNLKDIFNDFDTNLINEIIEVQTVFNEMEAAIEQCSEDKKYFDIQLKESLLTHDRLLDQIMSQDIVNIVTSCAVGESVSMSNCLTEKCYKCLELEAKLVKKNDMIERDVFDKLSEPPTFNQLFELNEIKAQSEAKETVIKKLKDRIKSMSEKANIENVKKDIDEIETINIELEHSVAKLLYDNENLHKEREHLKTIYQDQFDSIKKTRVLSKEHCDSLIAQLNAKSVENSDLNAQLQEKVFANALLKNELRKLKGKNVSDTDVSKPSAITIALGMFKLDIEKLFPRLFKNKDAHIDYLNHTQEQANILWGIVEQAKALRPLDNALDFVGNKVEEQVRKVKSRSNKKNRVKHSMSNVNSELIFATCDECLFAKDHDKCGSAYVNDVNVRLNVTKRENFGNLQVVQIVLWYLDSGCSKHMTRQRSQLDNFVSKFLDLEVAFRKHTCYIRDLEGVDLFKGSRGSNLYTLSLENMMLASPICLLSKASKTKSWLWHQRLSHLNFDYITTLAKQGKRKKHSHKPKAGDSIQEKLYLLHMDLYGPMRIQSINGRKYILVIIDDYSRFTWVKFLWSKDEVPAFVIKFLKMIQVRLNATVCNIRTDNGTKFVNQTLKAYYEDVGISHQTSVAHSPQQNGIVKHEDIGKLKPKADIGIFVGYALSKKAFRIYNKRAYVIIETIHVDFDELTATDSE